jgi:hypothetical protein
MTAGQDWWQIIIKSITPREYVTDSVNADSTTDLLTPTYKKIPTLPIFIGQRLTIATAFGGGADLRHIHQTLPQARTVDAQRGKITHGSIN